ncbi:DUF5047 domain-containing protein [Streptomyces sp. NBC_00237]|uniref:DUF5047 domain-containing protein n=1 Tax=Streptomyces sp. NBC_00237 TaxID=2975687 RepID=UPI002256B3F8|nr:DUF5047 domain-containing protein [Streptomyces sp. NBC_00237]MCX5202497.1 DUF5047 domain-containing protein [Streptomyces sp. NBC_00237]
MYPVSDRFLRRLAESHRPVTEVLLIRTDGEVVPLEHTGGSVSADRGQAIRRTCTVTIADVSLIPRTPADQLAMYGARLRISRGVDYGDGSQELVPLGVFRLDSVEGDPTDGPVTLTGKDISVCVTDDRFTAPYRATTTAVGAIETLILRSLPDATVIATAVDAAIGSRTWDVEADPWAAVQEIAASVGAVCFANPDGIFTIATLPDLLTTDPAWAVEASEGGVYVRGSRGMSADRVYNGVLARGEGAEANTAPVQWLATDADADSPTYWGGPFGRRPMFYSSSTLTSVNACQAAANLKLAAGRAPNAKGDFSALPNPALECGDVIRVTHPDGLRELHQVQSFSVPLDEGGDFPIATISAKEDA